MPLRTLCASVRRVVGFGSAVADLDDALVALAAGGWDADGEVVGVVEEGLAGF